jgi:Tfp pilus assembly protein PilO
MPAGTVGVDYQILPMSVLVRGDWVELIDYFQRLRNLDRGVRVLDSTFTYLPGEDGAKSLIESSVRLEVYMMAASTAGADAAATQPPVTIP